MSVCSDLTNLRLRIERERKSFKLRQAVLRYFNRLHELCVTATAVAKLPVCFFFRTPASHLPHALSLPHITSSATSLQLSHTLLGRRLTV